MKETGARGCTARTKKGKLCGAPASKSGSGFCLHHDPERRIEREARNAKGGVSGTRGRHTPAGQDAPDLSTTKGILAVLTFEAVGLVGQPISVSRARAMGGLCQAAASILRQSGSGDGVPVEQIRIYYNLAESEDEVGEMVGGVRLPYNGRDPIPGVPNAVAPHQDEVADVVASASGDTPTGGPAPEPTEPEPEPEPTEPEDTPEPSTNGDESLDLAVAVATSPATPQRALQGVHHQSSRRFRFTGS